MARTGPAAAACLLLAAHAVAADTSLPVRVLTVEETARYKAGETTVPADLCAKFRPAERQVADWLRHAREVDKRTYYVDGIISGCLSSGELTLQDGSRHRWYLDAGGGAVVEQEGRPLRYFTGEPFPL